MEGLIFGILRYPPTCSLMVLTGVYLYPHLPDLSHVVRLIVDCSLGTCVLTYKLIKRGKSVN